MAEDECSPNYDLITFGMVYFKVHKMRITEARRIKLKSNPTLPICDEGDRSYADMNHPQPTA
jgi:hypothetical protein